MAFKLDRDWPVVAAVGLGLLALIMFSRRSSTLQPVVVGGGGAPGAEAAIEAQAQVSMAQIAAQTAAFQTYVTEFGATERTRAEAGAAVRAIELQTAVEREKAQFGFLGSIFSGIVGLFSWETTDAAVRYRKAANRRLEAAYG